MFVMRPNVFVAQVLGVFVPNLVTSLAHARPNRSCEDSPRLFLRPNAFFDQFKRRLHQANLLPISIISLNSLAKKKLLLVLLISLVKRSAWIIGLIILLE